VDATRLALGLELTLELLPLKKPVILALNMMDEADRLGLHINGPGLQGELGTPVLPLVASKGRGVKGVFLKALEVGRNGSVPKDIKYTKDENADERHGQARLLAQEFVRQGERRLSRRDRLDDVLLHPVWGYVVLLFVLYVFFQAVYGIGQLIEPPLLAFFDTLTRGALSPFGTGTLLGEIILGVMQGIAAGVAIVLPYLLPFLFGLGVLEDIGYLPRVAFLMDALMHRIGLHGKAVVPFILGYGCNVPAVMSTRTLEEPRDRYLAAALATLVPCAARLAVVFGLVAFYLGPLAAFALYLFNLLVIAVTGRILNSLLPEDTPGLILEMPTYRIPTLKNVTGKAWFRVREFVVEAWPILIVGSAVLAVLNYFNAATAFNWLVRPVTWSLGLPSEVGVPLIFGILRKELSLVMLGQALGSTNFASVLTIPQMVTYATFVMFYLPCLATLSVLRRELGTKSMLAISALTVVVAQVAAWIAWGVTVALGLQ
jgi:ferrous iron transport protein B